MRARHHDEKPSCNDCAGTPARVMVIPAESDGGFGSPMTVRALCETCAHELGLLWDSCQFCDGDATTAVHFYPVCDTCAEEIA